MHFCDARNTNANLLSIEFYSDSMEEVDADGPPTSLDPKDTEVLKQLLVVLNKVVNGPQTTPAAIGRDPKGKGREGQLKTPEDSFSRFSLDSGRDVSVTSTIDTDDSESIAHEEFYAQRKARIDDFEKKYHTIYAELTLVSVSFRTVGGSRSVINACRLVQEELGSLVSLVQNLHDTDSLPIYMQNNSTLQKRRLLLMEINSRLTFTCSNELFDAMKQFHKYHGERLDGLYAFAGTLQHSGQGLERAMQELDTDEYVCRKFFDDILPEVTRSITDAVGILRIIPEKVLPPIRGAEENATLRYLNMTTVATFFSAITATTLQFSFGETTSIIDNAVNLFWFLSLVFSISSAINSLLGMTWRKSAVAEPAYQLPRWAAVWLGTAPMVFLVIAAFSFITGLALFTYSSGQAITVASICTACICLHVLGLLFLTVWFIIILKQDRLLIIEDEVDGRKVRVVTMRDAGVFHFIRENMRKDSIFGKIRLRLFRKKRSQDLEPGAENDRNTENAAIELEEMSMDRRQEESGRDDGVDVIEPKADEPKARYWAPQWARDFSGLNITNKPSRKRKSMPERARKPPDSSRFPDANILNNRFSFTQEDVAYAMMYHMTSVHPRWDESFPYVTTRLHGTCPRPPSNASRYYTLSCTRCPVTPQVPLPHRGKPYPKIDGRIVELLIGKDWNNIHWDEAASNAFLEKQFQIFLHQRLHKLIDENMNAANQQNGDDNNGEGPSRIPGAMPDEAFNMDDLFADLETSFLQHLSNIGVVLKPSTSKESLKGPQPEEPSRDSILPFIMRGGGGAGDSDDSSF